MKRIGFLMLSALVMGGVGGRSAPSAAAATYKGFISDHRCGAAIDAACNKQCFQLGETPVLVLDGSGDIFDISNGEKVTSLPGAHVEVTGQLDAATKTLTVSTVKRID
jgi:hypothetical protein